MKKIVTTAIVLSLVIGCIPTFGNNSVHAATAPDPSQNFIIAPDTVKVNQKFTLALKGHNDTMVGRNNGDEKFVPYSWSIQNSTPYRYGFAPVIFNDETFKPYSVKTSISKPGKYKIDATFNYTVYRSISGIWYWNQNLLKKYNKSKEINVQGKVKFNPNKGKLKKSKKAKYVNHKGKIGKLPKPTRKGYKFQGWYAKKNGKGKKIKASTKVNFSKASKTYYAKWKKK